MLGSPDLSPLDFWFFAYLKRKVFSQIPHWAVIRPQTFFHLKQKLMATVQHIRENEKHLIIKSMQNFIVSLYSLGLCIKHIFYLRPLLIDYQMIWRFSFQKRCFLCEMANGGNFEGEGLGEAPV